MCYFLLLLWYKATACTRQSGRLPVGTNLRCTLNGAARVCKPQRLATFRPSLLSQTAPLLHLLNRAALACHTESSPNGTAEREQHFSLYAGQRMNGGCRTAWNLTYLRSSFCFVLLLKHKTGMERRRTMREIDVNMFRLKSCLRSGPTIVELSQDAQPKFGLTNSGNNSRGPQRRQRMGRGTQDLILRLPCFVGSVAPQRFF